MSTCRNAYSNLRGRRYPELFLEESITNPTDAVAAAESEPENLPASVCQSLLRNDYVLCERMLECLGSLDNNSVSTDA